MNEEVKLYNLLKRFKKCHYAPSISKRTISIYLIYLVNIIQLILAIYAIFSLRLSNNIRLFFLCVTLIFVNTFLFACFEYIYKMKRVKKLTGEYGSFSELYAHKSKMAILSGIAITIGVLGFFVRKSIIINYDIWTTYYWIWFSIIMFVGLGVRYIDIVSIFSEKTFISGNYEVAYDKITDLKVIARKTSHRGEIYIVDIYKDNIIVGFDKVFADDYSILNEKVRLREY